MGRSDDEQKTEGLAGGQVGDGKVRAFTVRVVAGPDQGASTTASHGVCSVGTNSANDITLSDSTVSRFHCEIEMRNGAGRLRDLDSSNGTSVDGVRIADAYLRGGSRIALGRTTLEFEYGRSFSDVPTSDATEFGSLHGVSVALRRAFAMLEAVAPTDATVLISGETGTGKEGAAQGIHDASARSNAPFVVVDCAAIPAELMESELFGHERGAFTGANERRIGAFEEAHGGTLLLDEVGELPLELQPKLLRVLEAKCIRRIGRSEYVPVDVRVVAATNRDLRLEVNAGRFREDLYYRLAVVTVRLPALRERPEDIEPTASAILERLGASHGQMSALLTPQFLARLQQLAWPGNARELRNYLERVLLFGEDIEQSLTVAPDESALVADEDMSSTMPHARRRAIARWERAYLHRLLTQHRGKKAAAIAREVGIDRHYLYRLLRRHGLELP